MNKLKLEEVQFEKIVSLNATERLHYHGGVITLELDHSGLWWAKALGKLFGPCKEKSYARGLAEDWIDSRVD